MEIRSFGNTASPQIGNESRTIEGYAIVFGQESEVLFDKNQRKKFIEIIMPSAVTNELLQRSDVKALLEHNVQRLLARSLNGKGTLALSVDSHGLKYRFDSPSTPDGDYAVEMVRRGDLFGSSFAYATGEKNVRYEKRSDGMLMRYVDKIEWIGDVSIVSDPAYMGTDVTVRSIEMLFPDDNDKYKDEVKELRSLANC
nr:MAG TPA: prohead serine protease [Caudoviricetes sp.]